MFDRYKTKPKIIINGVLLVLSIGVYLVFWYGTDNLVSETKAIQDNLLQSDAGEKKIETIRRLFSERSSDVEAVRGYVLSEDDIVGFIEELENLSRRAGVEGEIQAVSAGNYPGVDASKWESLNVVVSSTGSWEATYRFLSLLESLSYRSELRQATIERIEREGSEGEEAPGEILWQGDFTLAVLKNK